MSASDYFVNTRVPFRFGITETKKLFEITFSGVHITVGRGHKRSENIAGLNIISYSLVKDNARCGVDISALDLSSRTETERDKPCFLTAYFSDIALFVRYDLSCMCGNAKE